MLTQLALSIPEPPPTANFSTVYKGVLLDWIITEREWRGRSGGMEVDTMVLLTPTTLTEDEIAEAADEAQAEWEAMP